MTNDELAGRLLAVETIAMTALGLYLSNNRNDPDFQKSAALIEGIREAIAGNSRRLSNAAADHAISSGEELLAAVAENLRPLRGHSGRLQ